MIFVLIEQDRSKENKECVVLKDKTMCVPPKNVLCVPPKKILSNYHNVTVGRLRTICKHILNKVLLITLLSPKQTPKKEKIY